MLSYILRRIALLVPTIIGISICAFAFVRVAEQRELDELPARIEALETEQRTIAAAIADPEFYRQPATAINAALERTQAIEQELLDLYARWDTLDSRSPAGRAD